MIYNSWKRGLYQSQPLRSREGSNFISKETRQRCAKTCLSSQRDIEEERHLVSELICDTSLWRLSIFKRLDDTKFYSNHTAMILGWFLCSSSWKILNEDILIMTRFPQNLLSTSKNFESKVQEIAWLNNKGASIFGQCSCLNFFDHICICKLKHLVLWYSNMNSACQLCCQFIQSFLPFMPLFPNKSVYEFIAVVVLPG